jgi:hypothetical protein
MRRNPFTQADIKVRAAPLTPLGERNLRKLANIAGINSERSGGFVKEIAAEIDHYRRFKQACLQERAAAKAAAGLNVVEVCERLRNDLRPIPASVRALILGAMQMSEPTEAGIARARNELSRFERHVAGHREGAITPALKALARTLQTIACQFAPSLKDDPTRLRHWLGEALLVAGEKSPGKNQRQAYFAKLLLKPEVIAAIFDEASHVRLPILHEKRIEQDVEQGTREARLAHARL